MLTVSVEEGRPAVMLCNAASCEKHFQYYDVHFTARSYVYRQVSVNIECGRGQIKIYEKIRIMLVHLNCPPNRYEGSLEHWFPLPSIESANETFMKC